MANYRPVTIVPNGGGPPFTHVTDRAPPATVVVVGAPISLVDSGAPAITLYDTDGNFFDISNVRVTEDGHTRLTEDGDERVIQAAAIEWRETEDDDDRVTEADELRVLE